MNAILPDRWTEQNHLHLAAALERLRLRMDRFGAAAAGTPADPVPTAAEPPYPTWDPKLPPPALDRIAGLFGLSTFERDLLLLVAAAELDTRFPQLFGQANGDPSRDQPTFALALAVLPGASWSALSPMAPLRHWRLIEVGRGTSLVHSPLRIDECILGHLVGVSHRDMRLAALSEPVADLPELTSSQLRAAERTAGLWRAGAAQIPAVILTGGTPAIRRAVAVQAANVAGMGLISVAAGALPTGGEELEGTCIALERESALTGCALLLGGDREGAPDVQRDAALLRLVERVNCPVLVSGALPMRDLLRPAVTVETAKPTRPEQEVLWLETLGREGPSGMPEAGALSRMAHGLSSEFDLDAANIRTAAADARARAMTMAEEGTADGDPVDRLWRGAADACRTLSRTRLEALAQRIVPKGGWEDLVLPDRQMQMLHAIAGQIANRTKVQEEWGFADKGQRGLGLTVLFAGSSGTGKTTAAEVLARELRLDLYRLDLSSVVSKYIGETEKNLARIFDAAEEGGVILLFDEADSLFGKRSEVKDSHDRYANLEVSYLLQRVEAFRGLAVLTSNMKEALDSAFLRRLRFVVQFPFPDLAQRAQIWRRAFPSQTPTEGLDPQKLAQLSIAGGNIKTIALNAAYLAASDGLPVGMAHVLAAARIEYGKLEKTLTEQEIRGWLN